MRIIAALFALMFIVVGVGFYFQATHDWRKHSRLEAAPKMQFQTGDRVRLREPVPVCRTPAIAIEARRMTLRMTRNKPKPGDVRMGREWFEEMKESVRMAEDLEILAADVNQSRVRIASGPDAGFEGYVFTVGLEEASQPTSP